MILSCRNGYINNLQLAICNLQEKYYNAMRSGLKSTHCLYNKINILTKYIKVLKGYRVLGEEELVQRIEFLDAPGGWGVNNITVGYDAHSYVFFPNAETELAEDVAREFYEFIMEDTVLPSLYGFIPTIDGSYVYFNLDISDQEDFICRTNDLCTKTVSEENGTELLNIWNCLTYAEICALIQHGLRIKNQKC